MSKLNELLNRIRLTNVTYMTVGDICKISRGIVMSKDFIRDNPGLYPVYSSQTENNGELGKIKTYMFDGEYLTWTTDGANAGSIFYRNGKFNVTNVCGLLKVLNKNINAKFLYYVLQKDIKSYVNKGMGNPKLMSNVMAKIKVPIPPSELQREIVLILDKFAELTTKLANELILRKKQYEFYRNMLLSFNTLDGRNIRYEKISHTNKVLRGKRLTSRNLDENGKFAVFHGGNKPIGFYDKHNREGNTVMIINVGGSAGFVGYSKEDFWSSDGCYCLAHSKEYNNRFLYYYLSKHQDFLVSKVRHAGIPTLDISVIENILVPVISIEEQEKIVKRLDIFDSICFNTEIGLPAEITARQKQYEYYRDKLLTFKELK